MVPEIRQRTVPCPHSRWNTVPGGRAVDDETLTAAVVAVQTKTMVTNLTLLPTTMIAATEPCDAAGAAGFTTRVAVALP